MKKLLLVLLLLKSVAYAQDVSFAGATGNIIRNPTPATFTNTVTTDQTLFSKTITGNTMTIGRPYAFTCYCSLTTGLVTLPAITFKVKLGSNTMTFVNAATVLGGLTANEVTISGFIVLRIDGTILVYFSPSPTAISAVSFLTSNLSPFAVWSGVDTTSDQLFSVTVGFSSTITSCTLTRQYYARSDF